MHMLAAETIELKRPPEVITQRQHRLGVRWARGRPVRDVRSACAMPARSIGG
jgi:hypothetical protein